MRQDEDDNAKTTEQDDKENAAPTVEEGTEKVTLSEAIKKHAEEGDEGLPGGSTLRKILGGDILSTSLLRRQVGVLLIITFFLIVYISNRYSCQRKLIEIDALKKEMQDAKYKALSSTSMLTEKCRESRVLEKLRESQDTTIQIARQPPYVINIPKK